MKDIMRDELGAPNIIATCITPSTCGFTTGGNSQGEERSSCFDFLGFSVLQKYTGKEVA